MEDTELVIVVEERNTLLLENARLRKEVEELEDRLRRVHNTLEQWKQIVKRTDAMIVELMNRHRGTGEEITSFWPSQTS